MTKYEFICIMDPSLDEAGATANYNKYTKLLRDQGSEITYEEPWGRKKLAYEIDKKTEGTYFYLRMSAPTAAVAELNRQLRYDENVMRTLVVLDEEWAARNEEAGRRASSRNRDQAAAPAATS